MPFKSPARRAFLALLLILAWMPPAGAATAVADNAALVARAHDQIKNERFVEGLASAREAARKNPQDYKAAYYVALASLALGRFDDADIAVARARALAPDSARDSIDHLQANIKARRESLGTLQAADAALAEGLVGKAARLYDQAWNADRADSQPGFKAADLYANRLGQPVDAARILRVLVADPKTSGAADAQLSRIATPLREAAAKSIALGDQSHGEQRRKLYRDAVVADPDSIDGYQKLAAAAAKDGDGDDLKLALKDMSARGRLDLALFNAPEFGPWLADSRFQQWMTDLVGASTLAKVLEDVAAEKERQKEIADAWVWKDDSWYDTRSEPENRSLEREQDRCDGRIERVSSRVKSAKSFECECSWTNHPAYGDYPRCRLTWTENTLLH
jgi:hypothetical protein